ncbi:MAG TPA: DUF6292 family protein [Pseudonocardia sp.]|jgi:hypothetical protein|nr:DUF6292 family protein [Pseudonocardia sp.]
MEVVEEVAEQGLRHYVLAVADGLGVRPSAVGHVPRPRAGAYLALRERLPDFAGREVAVVWDAHHGWGLGVETSSGEDLIMLAYLGEDVLPEPDEVVAFVRTLLRGQGAGQLKPPIVRSCDLRARLASYLPPELAD